MLAGKLLYTGTGKPRISIMSIAHLDDTERMFFVSMLLNELIGWMRAQQGTSSLRAILYMDEIFGYMPPVENPPSKKLLLTLLKQARAYGLGLVLATQNPVDLDYRGLSNTGTWMIGRLQTERDKARVMEGLEGASQGGRFDRQRMEKTLAGLGKRRFLLHNVHEDEAVVFNTRWAMSYLAGPLTRSQIKLLAGPARDAVTTRAQATGTAIVSDTAPEQPLLAPEIEQHYVAGDGDHLVYYPRLLAMAEITFTSARYNVDETREQTIAFEVDDGPAPIDWDNGIAMSLSAADLNGAPQAGAHYADCPSALADPKNYAAWEKDLKRWLRQNETVTLYSSKELRVTSNANESEGEFRTRLQMLANEMRDETVAKLRKSYASKATTLENRLLRAEQAIQREQQQSSSAKMSTAISFGNAILGAVLGRKRISVTTANKVGSAMRQAGSASKQAGDVKRARQTADKVRADLAALNDQLAAEVAALANGFNAQDADLKELPVRPKSTDIHVPIIGLAWLPYAKETDGRLRAAWRT